MKCERDSILQDYYRSIFSHNPEYRNKQARLAIEDFNARIGHVAQSYIPIGLDEFDGF
jgi:hypothetical protein